MTRKKISVRLPVMKAYGDMAHSLGAIHNQKSAMVLSQLIDPFDGKNASIDM